MCEFTFTWLSKYKHQTKHMNEYGFKFFLLDMAWSRGATTKSFCKEVIGQRKWQDHLVLNALEKTLWSDLASTGLHAVKSASQSFDHVPAHVQMCLSILLANYAAVFFAHHGCRIL